MLKAKPFLLVVFLLCYPASCKRQRCLYSAFENIWACDPELRSVISCHPLPGRSNFNSVQILDGKFGYLRLYFCPVTTYITLHNLVSF